MKITAMFWYLWSTRLVFSTHQQRHRHYDAAKLQINQDSEAHDASMNLPHHEPATHLPSAAPAYKDPVTFRFLLPRKPPALDSVAHDASMNLPHQVPSAAPAYKDPVTFKFLLPRKPAAPLKDSKVDAAHRHLQQKPLMHPFKDSDAQADSRRLPHQSQPAVNSKSLPSDEFIESTELHSLSSELSNDAYEQKNHISSDVSDYYYDEESRLYFDEGDTDSLYPEAAEEYVTEEEVAQANDEIELTDDFLTDYLSNEDLDIETEVIETE